MAPRIDLAALKRSLANARLIAEAVGVLRGAQPQARGLVTPCPVHGNRSASLSMQVRDGVLLLRCQSCGFGGSVLDLFAALEGSFTAGVARAVALAGGDVGVPTIKESLQVRFEPPALPDALAAALLGRVCEVGRLGGRGPVEAYLDRRGLLAAAQDDGWATLPSLPRLLDCAREVWQRWIVSGVPSATVRGYTARGSGGPAVRSGLKAVEGPSSLVESQGAEASGPTAPGAFAFSGPEDLLVAAKLTRRDDEGRLRAKWGRHRLVIPWRGRDGRIQALQRRLIDDPRPMRGGGEEPRYVFDGTPREPFGVHWLGEEEQDGADCGDSEGGNGVFDIGCKTPRKSGDRLGEGLARHRDGVRVEREARRRRGSDSHRAGQPEPIALVEGAVDALALRCLRPRSVPLGVPGAATWLSRWERHLEGRAVWHALDPDETGDRQSGLRAIDVARARGELGEGAARAKREALGQRYAAEDQIDRLLRFEKITADEAEKRRAALAPAWCALCGAPARWLCSSCGRVRPKAKDWGAVWEARIRRV